MRLDQETDGRSHQALAVTGFDHHPEPAGVDFSNTTQSIAGLSTYNLDVTLPSGSYQTGRVIILGGKQMSGGQWRECVEVTVSRTAAEAMCGSIEDVSFKKVYAATYAKAVGDSFLSHRIFDNNLSRIYLQDAVLTGSLLRLTFRNSSAIATTLWAKGQGVFF